MGSRMAFAHTALESSGEAYHGGYIRAHTQCHVVVEDFDTVYIKS